jgi:hypothetical protein
MRTLLGHLCDVIYNIKLECGLFVILHALKIGPLRGGDHGNNLRHGWRVISRRCPSFSDALLDSRFGQPGEVREVYPSFSDQVS